jgi:hypothetical protein
MAPSINEIENSIGKPLEPGDILTGKNNGYRYEFRNHGPTHGPEVNRAILRVFTPRTPQGFIVTVDQNTDFFEKPKTK